MNAIEKIISQMNEAAEQERAALEQEERMKIDQNFEQKRTQIETEHQKQKEKQIELLEKKYRQLRNRQQVEVRQENLNAKQEFLRRLFADAIAEMENWDEIDFMECEWASRLYDKGLYGFFQRGGRRYFLPAGDETSGGADRDGAAGLPALWRGAFVGPLHRCWLEEGPFSLPSAEGPPPRPSRLPPCRRAAGHKSSPGAVPPGR